MLYPPKTSCAKDATKGTPNHVIVAAPTTIEPIFAYAAESDSFSACNFVACPTGASVKDFVSI
jgi:hypothetical protein